MSTRGFYLLMAGMVVTGLGSLFLLQGPIKKLTLLMLKVDWSQGFWYKVDMALKYIIEIIKT